MNNQTTGALIAGEGFITYDPMGRVQWRLQNGQGSEYDLNYTYDYLGDVRSATNGAGLTLSSRWRTHFAQPGGPLPLKPPIILPHSIHYNKFRSS